MEDWKDIPEYEGLYQASTLGNIKSLPKGGSGGHSLPIVLKPSIDKDGYLFVSLYKGKRLKNYKVHRLIAQTFIESYRSDLEINHKNEIKDDNRVENLEMCDRQYNIDYGSRTRKYYRAIIQETLEGELVQEWESVKLAASTLGISACSISNCLRGYKQSWNGKVYPVHQAHGYKWKYK